ncbi:MAG: 30S ribosomal protein S2 [Candidatus Pacearchaeota archaeon]
MDIVKTIKKKIKEGEEELLDIVKKGEKAVEGVVKEVEKSVVGKSNKKVSKKTLEKKAEAESTTEEKDLEKKREELFEKAKKLREKISTEEVTSEELKEKVKIKKKEMLVPLEEYVRSGIYLGTRAVTPNMKPFVYRRRADGLAIFNTDKIDEKLREGIKFLSKFAPEDVILVCKREAGWRVVKKFGEITGIRTFTKKYPAGILTNKKLPDFIENELTIITDHWLDKNALQDTLRVHKKVLMICDTNNFTQGADKIIIGNNKSQKSLGLIFYLLAKGYCEERGLPTENIPAIDWWVNEEEFSDTENKENNKKIVSEVGIMKPEEGFGI